jgi:hypothetical protein
MKNTKGKIWIIFFVLPVFVACNNRQKITKIYKSVDVASNITNMHQIYLSEFTDDIKYVKIENSPDIFIGDHPLFDVSDSLILTTCHGEGLLIFDLSGNLVSKFGHKGRGPDEYLYISNPCIGNKRKVYFNSLSDLFEFNSGGSFVKKYSGCLNLEGKYILNKWCMVDDSLIFGHIDNGAGQIPFKALLINKFGIVKHSYLNYDLLQYKGSRIPEGSVIISQFDGSLYFKENFNDTLFVLNDKLELLPVYIFNLGDLKMPASIRVNFFDYFQKVFDYIAIENIFQTRNYLFLIVNFGKRFPAKRLTPKQTESPLKINTETNTTFCLGIYNKKNGELKFCKPTNTDNSMFTSGLYNNIDAGPRFFPEKMINDSTMVMSISSRDLKEHVASDDFKNTTPMHPEKKEKLEEIANSLSVFDNPIFMFVTFKAK